MIDYIKELLSRKANGATLLLFVLAVIILIFVAIGFVKLVKFCFAIEANNKKSAHTLLKTALIAFVPTIYSILSALNIADTIPTKIIIIVTTVISILVGLWNLMSFGIICGTMFTVMHIVFGVLASLGIGAFVFIAVAMVILMLFGGSTVSHGGAPSMIKDVNNGMIYHVVKGVNGELYVEDNGRSCILRSSDYSGRFFDDNGNEYISC